MMTKKGMLLTLIALLLAVPVAAEGLSADAISLVEREAPEGDEYVLVEVQSNIATPAYGFGLQLTYDPTYIRPVNRADVDGAEVFAPVGDIFQSAQRVINRDEETETGKRHLDVVYTLLAPAAPIEGEGTLVSVLFEKLQPGDSAIELANPRLISLNDGVAADVDLVLDRSSIVLSTPDPAAPAQPGVTTAQVAPATSQTLAVPGSLLPWLIALVILLSLMVLLLAILIVVVLVRIPLNTPLIVPTQANQRGYAPPRKATAR